MYYSIAGHILEISGEGSGFIPGFFPFLLESGSVNKPLISIRLSEKISCPDTSLLYRFTIQEGTCEFMKEDEYYIIRWFQTGGMLWHMKIQTVENEFVALSNMNKETDIHILRFSIWIAFGIAALHQQTVSVHASTLICRDRSILFPGESGTGKSTQSRLWQEYIEDTELLNDDSPFIRIDECGIPFVWGSPWSGKTPCYKNKYTPVAALVRLRQAPFNSIRRLRTIEAIGALQPSLPPIFAIDPVLSDLMLESLSSIIGQIPVYILDCLPDRKAVELLYNTLIKEGRL